MTIGAHQAWWYRAILSAIPEAKAEELKVQDKMGVKVTAQG